MRLTEAFVAAFPLPSPISLTLSQVLSPGSHLPANFHLGVSFLEKLTEGH